MACIWAAVVYTHTMNANLDLSNIWYDMVTAWMNVLVWIISPGMPNRLAMCTLLVFVLCYLGMVFGKFGTADALTE